MQGIAVWCRRSPRTRYPRRSTAGRSPAPARTTRQVRSHTGPGTGRS
jgi:hypothetical protein